jgi:hypothetical protein
LDTRRESAVAKEVVFIVSLQRSGSTLLDLMLGGHSRFVGLGEVFLLLKPDSDRLDRTSEEFCSCGTTIDSCYFWGPVCAQLRANRGKSIREKYEIVLSAFYQVFGEDCIPVDSSKDLKALQVLRSISGVEVKVLYLIRDVRSWIVSMRDARKRSADFYMNDLVRKHGWKAWVGYIKRTAVFFFQQWHFSNRKLQDFLKREKIPNFQLGYEELSLYPDFLNRDVCKFLGVEPVDSMFSLLDSGSHSVLGNRMRSQNEKRQRIFYDNRWFYRNDWLIPSVLFRNIMQYNIREVYRNIQRILWSR